VQGGNKRKGAEGEKKGGPSRKVLGQGILRTTGGKVTRTGGLTVNHWPHGRRGAGRARGQELNKREENPLIRWRGEAKIIYVGPSVYPVEKKTRKKARPGGEFNGGEQKEPEAESD